VGVRWRLRLRKPPAGLGQRTFVRLDKVMLQLKVLPCQKSTDIYPMIAKVDLPQRMLKTEICFTNTILQFF